MNFLCSYFRNSIQQLGCVLYSSKHFCKNYFEVRLNLFWCHFGVILMRSEAVSFHYASTYMPICITDVAECIEKQILGTMHML